MSKSILIVMAVLFAGTFAFAGSRDPRPDSSVKSASRENKTVIKKTVKEAPKDLLKDVIVVKYRKQDFLNEVKSINALIEEEQYSGALSALNRLEKMLRFYQSDRLAEFLPKEFQGFTIMEEEESEYESVIPSNGDIGLLLARHYKNLEDHFIDINIVYADASIADFVSIIKNPIIIDNDEQTRIIKVQNEFPAIEKYLDNKLFYERNIVLDDDVMVNIISKGLSQEALNEFCDKVDLKNIKTHLKSASF